MSRYQRSHEHLVNNNRIRLQKIVFKSPETDAAGDREDSDADLEEIELNDFTEEKEVPSDTTSVTSVNKGRLQRSRAHIKRCRQARRARKLKSRSENSNQTRSSNENIESIETVQELEQPSSSHCDQEKDGQISISDIPSTSKIPDKTDKTRGRLSRILHGVLNLWRNLPRKSNAETQTEN